MNLALPALRWLRAYEKGWLRGDVSVGITLVAKRDPTRRAAATADASPQGE